jgi:hypothetical protein
MLHLYIVIFTWKDEPGMVFSCHAKDAVHAAEQCENAYPGVYVESVVRTSNLEDM